MSVEAREIAVVLGGEKTLGMPVRQLRDLERIVKDGMPFAAIENIFRQLIRKLQKTKCTLWFILFSGLAISDVTINCNVRSLQ